MTGKNEMRWCSTTLMSKLFLVIILLQYSLGYSIYEEHYPESDQAFYYSLGDGVWDMHKKIPRGYMQPTPRVGKRTVFQEKRQSMIPQPRIGRQLDIEGELYKALQQMQNVLGKIQEELPNQSHSLNGDHLKLNPVAYAHGITVKSLSEENLSTGEPSDHDHINKEPSAKHRKDIPSDYGSDSIGEFKFGRPTLNRDENIPTAEGKYPGFDLFEEDKRQGGLIPAARLGRDALLATLEDIKPQTNAQILAYPRIGRRFWEMHRTLIPYPRAGRFIFDPETLDYDILLNSDYGVSGLDTLTDAFLNKPSIIPVKRSLKLVPRIGRKKRSVTKENGEGKSEVVKNQDLPSEGDIRSFFDDLEDIDSDYYFRSDQGMDKRRSKMTFVPRVGKKRSDEDFKDKKAMAFTPRVGRTAFVPRIGRNDARFRMMSRAAFIPRVGKRPYLIPRLGRSESMPQISNNSN